MTMIFKCPQDVKLLDTGERVTVVEILPVGTAVFYRIEFTNGDVSLVMGSKLRPCN
jgi:hypothetical protein